MRRIMLTIAYDGTDYCGWQMQPNGITIEEVLNKTISELCGEDIQVIGASRTDSGVHALGAVAVFDTNMRMEAGKFCYAINQRLPGDIRIQESREVPKDWHPRKQNSIKTYEYTIYNSRIANPLVRRNTYFCYFKLDIEKMQEATGYLIGTHDFKSFCSLGTQTETTVRTIYELTVNKYDEMIVIDIKGNGFLYNMVRIIVGTLIKIGTGAYPPEHVKEILDARDRLMAGPKVPPEGLCLIGLEYESLL